MYWTTRHDVRRANISDGGNIEVISNVPSFPVGVAITPDASHVYWVDLFDSKIQRAGLFDGSNVEDIVVSGLQNPWDVVIEFGTGPVADAGLDQTQMRTFPSF